MSGSVRMGVEQKDDGKDGGVAWRNYDETNVRGGKTRCTSTKKT